MKLSKFRGMQERGEHQVTNHDNNDGITVTGEQIQAIIDLLNRTPRTTILNIGATAELVHVVDKADSILEKMHQLAYGQRDYKTAVDERLFKIFKSLNDKVEELTAKVNAQKETPKGFTKSYKTIAYKRNHNFKKMPSNDTFISDGGFVVNDQGKVINEPEYNFEPYIEIDNAIAKSDLNDVNGYKFSSKIPVMFTNDGRGRFAWVKSDNQKEMLKDVVMELINQGVDIRTSGRLKELKMETLYQKYKSLYATGKGWKAYIKSVIKEKKTN